MPSRRTLCGAMAVAALGLPFARPARAQAWPARPVRLVVPYPPGGTTAIVAQVVSQQLSERLKQPVVVDPRPGGNTMIGGQIVANAQPDGYTLLFIGGSSMSSVYNRAPAFDLWKAFTPVAPLYQGPYFLIANPQFPPNSVAEFVQYAKAHRGQLNYGASGPGTMLATEALKTAAGLDITHVPYKGSSQVTLALLSNEIQIVLDAIVSYRQHPQSGALKILASGGKSRSADFPDVPTLAESGFPGFETVFNGGVWAPTGTPRPVVEQLNVALNEIARTPPFREATRQAGAEPITGSPEDFGRIIRTEIAFWARAAEAAGYRPE